MRILLIIFIGLMSFQLLAQTTWSDFSVPFSPTQYRQGAPLWTHHVFDSTNVGLPIQLGMDTFGLTDGYNRHSIHRTNNWQPIIKNDKAYLMTISHGTGAHNWGGVLQKLDLSSGELRWTSVFDDRHVEFTEYPDIMRLGGDELQVFTHRRIGSHTEDFVYFQSLVQGADAHLSKRIYNTNTGELIAHHLPNPDTDSLVIIKPATTRIMGLTALPDGDFVWAENQHRNEKQLKLTRLDEDGVFQSFISDTTYHEFDSLSHPNILTTADARFASTPAGNTLFYHGFFQSGTSVKDQGYVTVYDPNLEIQKIIRMDQLQNATDERVARTNLWRADDSYMVFRLDSDGPIDSFGVIQPNYRDYFVDYDGNVVATFDPYELGLTELGTFGYVREPFYLPHSNQFVVIGYRRASDLKFLTEGQLEFWLSDGGDFERVHTIKFDNLHYASRIFYCGQLEGGDLLVSTSIVIYDPTITDRITVSTPTDTWMRVAAEDLGITVSTKEATTKDERWRVSPNPVRTGSQLMVTNESFQGGDLGVRLLDTGARTVLMQQQSLAGNALSITIPNALSSGIYFLELTDSTNGKRQVERIMVE